MHRKLLAAAALVSTLGACATTTVPSQLAPLNQELARLTIQEDAPGNDTWLSAAQMAQRGAGDCEDFAAFSYAWMKAHGLNPKLAIGSPPGPGYHAWVEVEVGGETWLADLDRVAQRRPLWRPMGPGAVALQQVTKFGPEWPAERAASTPTRTAAAALPSAPARSPRASSSPAAPGSQG